MLPLTDVTGRAGPGCAARVPPARRRPAAIGGRPPRGGTGPRASRLSTEVFTVPVDDDRFLVYAPLRRTAFLTNARGVDALAEL
jgi:hypothetical protein